jgi:hypothetical protein
VGINIFTFQSFTYGKGFSGISLGNILNITVSTEGRQYACHPKTPQKRSKYGITGL